MKTVIIEDEPIVREDLQMMLRTHENLHFCGSAPSITEGVRLMEEVRPELLFLDLRLSDGEGFEVLERCTHQTFRTIILTGYEQHAPKAIRAGAFDYLLKPLTSTMLQETLDRLARFPPRRPKPSTHFASPQNSEVIAVNGFQIVHFIQLSQLVRLRSMGCYTVFQLTDNRHIVSSRTMKEYEERLPAWFVRTHNSHVVNLRFAEALEKNVVLHMSDGSSVPVSQRRRDDLLQAISQL